MPLSKFQIELLKKIPREPLAHVTTNEMANRLRGHWANSNSLASMRRKIIYNLERIERAVPSSLDKIRHGHENLYRMKASTLLLLLPMSQEQMMAFGLLSKFGTDLLTKKAHRALAPFFEAAKESATDLAKDAGFGVRESKNLSHQWLEKIAVLPAVLPFCPLIVDENIKQIVDQALLLGSRLQLKILHLPSNKEEDCQVSPLALVQQGVRTYLVAKRFHQKSPELFLMKRILAAKEVAGSIETPSNWNLQKFLERGIGHPFFSAETYGKVVNVELKVHANTQWLKETPPALDPIIEELKDGGYIMKMDMPITEELVHWLLSMAFHVKVVKPDFLVARLKGDLKKSAAMYR